MIRNRGMLKELTLEALNLFDAPEDFIALIKELDYLNFIDVKMNGNGEIWNTLLEHYSSLCVCANSYFLCIVILLRFWILVGWWVKGEVQLNNNAIWKVRGDNTNEHGIIVFINSAIEMKNISFKVFSYTLCL